MTRLITLISETKELVGKPTLKTRPVEHSDSEALARLLFSSYDDGRLTSQAHALTEIEAVLGGEHGEFYTEASPVVIDDHDRVVAAALCLRNRTDGGQPSDVPAIYELFTAASRRREGLAEKLIRQSLSVMRSDGLEEVSVRIPESNAAALALYLTLEFRRWQDPSEDEEIV